jgi:endonuclease YncB( thermonuclease family)
MIARIKYTAVLTLALLLVYPSISSAIHFRVVRVYDGDTVKAVGQGIEIKGYGLVPNNRIIGEIF